MLRDYYLFYVYVFSVDVVSCITYVCDFITLSIASIREKWYIFVVSILSSLEWYVYCFSVSNFLYQFHWPKSLSIFGAYRFRLFRLATSSRNFSAASSHVVSGMDASRFGAEFLHAIGGENFISGSKA